MIKFNPIPFCSREACDKNWLPTDTKVGKIITTTFEAPCKTCKIYKSGKPKNRKEHYG